MRVSVAAFVMIVSLVLGLGVVPSASGAQGKTLHGWLSDERCAGERARGGNYTATNPDCAKKCVAKGAKIVLIVPDLKKILNIANQEAAKNNIGDYVELTGNVDQQSKVVRIDSLKMLTK